LTSQLTQKSVDYRSLELRYNHIDLQNAALLKQVLAMRAEISRLEFEGAVAEDNIQLLQVKDETAAALSLTHPASSLFIGSFEFCDAIRIFFFQSRGGQLGNVTRAFVKFSNS
jgi:hypothetical protein